MGRIPQRNDAHVQDAWAFVCPFEGLRQHFPVIFAGEKHDLHMKFDAVRKETLERINACLRMFTDEARTHVGIDGMQRHPQRRKAHLDDALLIFRCHIRQRHECPTCETEPVIVVAHIQRIAHAARKLMHEAERASVAALAHGIEHDAFEGDSPTLPFIALECHLTRIAIEIDISQGQNVIGTLPTPVDDVAQGLAVDRRDDATWSETRIIGRGKRLNVHDMRTRAMLCRTGGIDCGIACHDGMPYAKAAERRIVGLHWIPCCCNATRTNDLDDTVCVEQALQALECRCIADRLDSQTLGAHIDDGRIEHRSEAY